MGGRIAVESEYGQGAIFRFFIRSTAVPSSSPELESPTITTMNSPALSPALSLTEAQDYIGVGGGPNYHVLITEDNIINQVCVSLVFRYLTVNNCDLNNMCADVGV